jgi:hypothetical protein
MGVDHLQGKRTGRPRGSKTTPAWVRDLRWAERHLGRPDAAPPSPLAARLLALGREQPDKFLACLALRDARGRRAAPPRGPAPPADLGPPGPAGCTPTPAGDRPRRVRVLVMPLEYLVSSLTGGGPVPRVRNLPAAFQVAECAAGWDREAGGRWRRVLRVTLASADFPEVPPGAPVPELAPDFGR